MKVDDLLPTALAGLNPASIVVAPMAAGEGTVVNHLNGTVTYAAPAGPGTYSTIYTICDLQLLAALVVGSGLVLMVIQRRRRQPALRTG